MSDTTVRITDLQEVATLTTGAMVAVDSAALGTRKYDLGQFVANVSGNGLVWDDDNGYYTNASISNMLTAKRDGLAYGVSIPKGSTVACTKTGANAGIAAPTPGYVGTPAVDPYTQLGPFLHYNVNGYVDADGTPHVTAFEGDGNYAIDGSNGSVWVLAPVLYWLMDTSDSDAVTLSISDTNISGLGAQPQAYLPDGTRRPYMLYAKYAGSDNGSSSMVSVSGAPFWNFSVSHNSLITQCATASTGYSGKSIADDWYVKVMFLLKYATKNNQSVFAGCTNYNLNYEVTVAESNVTRAIISTANAANLVVGSSVTVATTSKGRDICAAARILSIATYDDSNSVINLDAATAFTTAVGNYVSTMPWHSGALDDVEGDGSVSSAGLTNSKEPFKLQGIECMLGAYEVLGDVIISSDGSTGWQMCVNKDSRNETTSVTTNYTATGKYLYSGSSDASSYPLYPDNASGLLFGTGSGASTSTGMCDYTYTNATSTCGTREWLGLGYLSNGAYAGLWCVGGIDGLSGAGWIIGSRLSATGRGR